MDGGDVEMTQSHEFPESPGAVTVVEMNRFHEKLLRLYGHDVDFSEFMKIADEFEDELGFPFVGTATITDMELTVCGVPQSQVYFSNDEMSKGLSGFMFSTSHVTEDYSIQVTTVSRNPITDSSGYLLRNAFFIDGDPRRMVRFEGVEFMRDGSWPYYKEYGFAGFINTHLVAHLKFSGDSIYIEDDICEHGTLVETFEEVRGFIQSL